MSKTTRAQQVGERGPNTKPFLEKGKPTFGRIGELNLEAELSQVNVNIVNLDESPDAKFRDRILK